MNRTHRIGPAVRALALALGALMLSVVIASAFDTPNLPAPPHRELQVCEVHKVPLVDEDARIVYGLPAFNKEALAAMKVQDTLFPHAVPYVLGGCIIDKDSPKTRLVHYCPVCRVARTAWLNGYEAGEHSDEDN